MMTKKTSEADRPTEQPTENSNFKSIYSIDLSSVFQETEKFRAELNQVSSKATLNNMVEAHAVTTNAIEMSLAVLAESVNLPPIDSSHVHSGSSKGS